jgi:hypothetical protein
VSASNSAGAWPELPYESWSDTCSTLHMWSQIVGKVRMELSPPLNHYWHVTFYVSAEGLTTSPIPDGGRNFEILFDFLRHELVIRVSDGSGRSFDLEPMSVAAFYNKLMSSLAELGIEVSISAKPNEVPEAIPFPQDTVHSSYDPEYAARCWQALIQIDRVLKVFRGGFYGKASPVHFFWGGFDMAVTRFSGRRAPPHPGGVPNCPDYVQYESYSDEVSSAGWWPGQGAGEPMFYSYAYPQPEGFASHPVRPEAAHYHEGMGEFLLPYEAVRIASDPDAALLEFLQSTYEAAAELGNWDRNKLERLRRSESG